MPEPGILGVRVLLTRRRLGLTQAQLAKAVGVSSLTIARLERGETQVINSETLKAMSQALGVSTDYLLGLTNRREGGPSDVPEGSEDLLDAPLHATAVES